MKDTFYSPIQRLESMKVREGEILAGGTQLLYAYALPASRKFRFRYLQNVEACMKRIQFSLFNVTDRDQMELKRDLSRISLNMTICLIIS